MSALTVGPAAKPSNLRRMFYTLAILVILGVNGQALAQPVSDRMAYYYSHLQSQKEQYGVWDTTKHPSPVRSIHAAMLHTGKVLLVAGSGNDEKNFDAKSFRSVLWDPKTGAFQDVPTPWDAFCAGHIFLPDGNLLIAGGTKEYEDLNKVPKQDFAGLKDSFIFNATTERYERVDSMDYARWYPTLTGLADGSVLSFSGLDEKGEIIYGHTERFDPSTKQWELQPGLNRTFPTYPAMFLTNDGKLFYSGSNAGYGSTEIGRTPGLWDLSNNTFQEYKGIEDPDMLETSASLLLPPAQKQRFMVMGGGGVGDSPKATNRTAIIDLLSANPQWTKGPDLPEPTRYPNAVILPDDTVLKTGGSRGYRGGDVLSALIYHPNTNTFSTAASPTVGRNYHSEALLLPDGRVATFGSNPLEENAFEMRIEIYSPAYMFKGQRPSIQSGDDKLNLGGQAFFKTSNPDNIASVKLIRPSSVTHVTDVEQRSVDLEFQRTATGVNATLPENANLLPPGYYMAFVTDKQGLPSEAYWVHVE